MAPDRPKTSSSRPPTTASARPSPRVRCWPIRWISTRSTPATTSTIRTWAIQPRAYGVGLRDSRAHPAVHGFGAAAASGQHCADGGLRWQPGPQPLPAQHHQFDRRSRHEPDNRSGHRGPPVRQPLRRDRLQNQRRNGQLQRHADHPQPPIQLRPLARNAVHLGAQHRRFRRVQRSQYCRRSVQLPGSTMAATTSTSGTASTSPALYDLPVGKGRKFLRDSGRLEDAFLGRLAAWAAS